MVQKWDASQLPFLEEKLKFRKKALGGADFNGTVLCVYAGGEARLTRMYARHFKTVIAVDKSLPELPQNVIRFEMTDKRFLNEFVHELPGTLEVLDVDPYGSPMPFLQEFLSAYPGIIRKIIFTDGALTVVRLRRKINLFKHYGLLPDKVSRPKRWHYEHFPLIVFSRIKELVQEAGYQITYYEYEYNRYKMGLYGRVDLWRKNGENSS